MFTCNTQNTPTGKALTRVLTAAGTDIEGIMAKHMSGNEIVFGMTAKRKRLSTIISNATGKGGYDRRILVQGAVEIVINSCSHYLNEKGERTDLNDKVS